MRGSKVPSVFREYRDPRVAARPDAGAWSQLVRAGAGSPLGPKAESRMGSNAPVLGVGVADLMGRPRSTWVALRRLCIAHTSIRRCNSPMSVSHQHPKKTMERGKSWVTSMC